VLADAADAVAETSEVDNLWVGQWVWPPRVTTKAVPLPRPEPPRLTLLPVPNCDGFSFTHTPGTAWVVGIMPESDLDDYDLYVYDDYSDSQNGFSNLIGRSALPFGSIDFVVGHYDNAPTTVYPGVLRYTATDGEGYTIDQNDAGGRNGSGTATFSNQVMDAGRVVDVYEAYLSAGTTYGFTLDIQAGPAAELSMFPSDSGGVYDRGHETALAWPVGSQQRYLLYEANQTGYYPIVVWRLEAAHTGTIDYSLSWGPLDPTGVPGEPSPPSKLALRAPSPNPFASATTLAFDLPTASDVRIEIYDIRGQRIAVLADKSYPPGRHQVAWTGRDDRGARVASGLYYARLAAGGRSFVQRMTVLF
jgi:hypothetical protein